MGQCIGCWAAERGREKSCDRREHRTCGEQDADQQNCFSSGEIQSVVYVTCIVSLLLVCGWIHRIPGQLERDGKEPVSTLRLSMSYRRNSGSVEIRSMATLFLQDDFHNESNNMEKKQKGLNSLFKIVCHLMP